MPDDVDYARILFGRYAVHVPAWLYVQHQGDGTVLFVGASKVPDLAHPLRYGSDRTHQFIVGEVIVRPHRVVATDALRGSGVSFLAGGSHDLGVMLGDGEVILDNSANGALPNL